MSRIAGRKCSACLIVAAWIVGFACNVLGQQNAVDPCAEASSPRANLPAFEVATVKPFNPRGGIAGFFVYPGGRVGAGHLNLRMLLMFACNVQTFQVAGGPGWADSDYFNIEAKPPDSSPSAQSNPASPKLPPTDEQRQMLLALLLDRFHLTFHVASREGPVYLLQRGGGDLKLSSPKDVSAAPWVSGADRQGISRDNGLSGVNISMPLLAAKLSQYLGRPVLDRTGIQGSFDFNFKSRGYDPNTELTLDDLQSTIFTSIRGIGLKLTSAKGPVETIVIDHAEPPSPN
jgi:uncharacterized protein (TIGR03435 family)